MKNEMKALKNEEGLFELHTTKTIMETFDAETILEIQKEHKERALPQAQENLQKAKRQVKFAESEVDRCKAVINALEEIKAQANIDIEVEKRRKETQ